MTACGGSPQTLAEAEDWVHRRHPQVAEITVAELHARDPQSVTIFDVRDVEEIAVSHLAGSYIVWTIDQARATIAHQPGREVVVVCSVGERSAVMAEALQDAGISALNLRGGIFAWATAGYPMVHGDKPVTLVHPYNEKWGKLLDPSLRSK